MNHGISPRPLSRQRKDAGVPIFVSPVTTLVICVMVFGVLHAVATANAERFAVDGLLGINALLYIAAAWLAHAALRTQESFDHLRFSRHANRFFMAGLSMTILGTCCAMLIVAMKA
jgi:fumarate reductase subunit D